MSADAVEKQCIIYALYDPKDGICRYVGKTEDTYFRLINHIAKSKHQNGRFPVQKWILGLIDGGRRPEIKTLEICKLDNWRQRERFWISELRKNGSELLNRGEGGGGPDTYGLKTVCDCGAIKSKKKNGTLICKPCSVKYQAEYNEKNRETRRKATRDWYHKNKEKHKAYRKAHREEHSKSTRGWYQRNRQLILAAKRAGITLTKYKESL